MSKYRWTWADVAHKWGVDDDSIRMLSDAVCGIQDEYARRLARKLVAKSNESDSSPEWYVKGLQAAADEILRGIGE